MTLGPEQKKVIERCAAILKRACGGLKRVVFDLAPDHQPDTVHYEIHGRIKLTPDEEPRRMVDVSDSEK